MTPTSLVESRTCCWKYVLLLALLLVVATVYLAMKRDPGDTIQAWFRDVTADLSDDLALAPESDSVAALARGFDIVHVARLEMQPCSKQCPDQQPCSHPCVWNAAGGATFHVSMQASGPTAKVFPVVRVPKPLPTSACQVNMSAADHDAQPQLKMKSVPTSGCSVEVENTLAVPAGSPDGWTVWIAGAGFDEEIPVGSDCSRGKTTESDRGVWCRTTLRASGPQGCDDLGIVITYTLRDRRSATVLRGSNAAPISMLTGTLGVQGSTARCPWQCRALPGDVWQIAEPKLRDLTMSGDDIDLLKANIDGYGSVSCPWDKVTFISVLASLLGFLGISAVQLVRCYRRRGSSASSARDNSSTVEDQASASKRGDTHRASPTLSSQAERADRGGEQ